MSGGIKTRRRSPAPPERRFVADVAGLNAEVLRPQDLDLGGVGIGTSVIVCNLTGQPLLAITIRHDGTTLTALLDEAKLSRLADMMATFVERLPTLQSEARH